jgi:tetratricopeptide (TPR) repeat protein
MNRKLRRAAHKTMHKHAGPALGRSRIGSESKHARIAALFAQALRCQRSGRHAEAVAAYDQIIGHDSKLAAVHCNRGMALANLGRLAEAEAAYARAIALNPDLPEAHNDLGELLRRRGRYDDAAKTLARAVALNPRNAEAFGNLGNALKDQGKFAEAAVAYRAAVRLAPRAAQCHNNLGAVLCDQGRLDEAEQSLRQALALDPHFLEADLNLGNVLREQGRLGEAEAVCRRAIALAPDHADAHCNLGSVLIRLGRLHEAEAAYRRTVALKPNMADAHYNLGVTLKLLGRLDEAHAAVARAVQLSPRTTLYLHGLSDLKRFAADNPHLAAMEELHNDVAALPARQRINLHFALAKAYDDLGRYDDAFRQLVTGNGLQRRMTAYDEAGTLAEIKRTGEVFSQELIQKLQGRGEPSPVPIFVIGMPRSGSTLIEQILASHPQVCGGGELPKFAAAMADTTTRGGVSLPDAIMHLSSEDLQRLGERYLAEITPLAPTAARIVDKTLSHFLYAGLIHLALPQARIIHAVRDPAATCLSCFSKVFASGQLYSYELAELGRLYRHYQALMDHWHRVLPQGRILDVRYEDVVVDLEGQARRMIAYCGLGWDERCLDFHKTERPILTASAVQVRQPLYRDALDRTRHYRHHLAPLLAELSGSDAEDAHFELCGGGSSRDAR